MTKRPASPPTTVGELRHGDIARLDAGYIRATSRVDGVGARWCHALMADLSEIPRGQIWLQPSVRVLELMPPPAHRTGGEEVDPLRGAP